MFFLLLNPEEVTFVLKNNYEICKLTSWSQALLQGWGQTGGSNQLIQIRMDFNPKNPELDPTSCVLGRILADKNLVATLKHLWFEVRL